MKIKMLMILTVAILCIAGCASNPSILRPTPPLSSMPGTKVEMKMARPTPPKKPMLTLSVNTNILSICQRTAPPSVNLSWCPVIFTNGVSASGYKIYWGVGPKITNWQGDIYDTNIQCGPVLTIGTNWCRCYSNSVDVGNVTDVTLTNIPYGNTIYFTATSYDVSNNESAYSEEVYRYIPQYLPLTNAFIVTLTSVEINRVQLSAKVCPDSLLTVQATTSLPPRWNVIATNQTPDSYGNFAFVYNVPPTNSMTFFRLELQ